MTDFFELISKRESCRDYDPERPVERYKLDKCISAAQIAPSACNSQPWKYILLTNRDLGRKMAKFLQEKNFNYFADNCPVFAIVLEESAILRRTKEGEPIEDQKFASIDIGLSVMQFCLAATEQGLSTCIMGAFNESKIKELLKLKTERPIRLVIGIGYAANDHLRNKIRKNLNSIAEYID